MIIFLLLLFVLCLYKIEFAFTGKGKAVSNGFYTDYLSVEKTNSIKGIFIVLVFLSHMTSFLTLNDNILNSSYLFLNGIIGQSMVALFMFYSGYAMMLSCMKKGEPYVKAIPVKRVLKVLINFDIAVLLFVIAQTIMGNAYSVGQILLFFTGWDSPGNSNWYIFSILILYIITYVSFKIGKKNKYIILAIACVLSALYVFIMNKFKPVYWYDTVFCYLFGMAWYAFRDKIEGMLKTKKIFWWSALIAVTVFYLLLVYFNTLLLLRHLLFAAVVVLVTMRVQINNKILNWLGSHLFSIYILQKLPMLVLVHFGLNDNTILFIAVSVAGTLAILYPFEFVIRVINKKFFQKNSNFR